MRNYLATIIGKTVRFGLILRPNGGNALPGLIVENIFPGYVQSMLQKLPDGVVIITGTNGKTTTTKIVTELLKSQGKKVLTNTTGSNLTRGIASSISRHARITGSLPFDMAVLEVDEAQAGALVRKIKPRWVLALNVSRDQLDRFGEVDTIAGYIKAAMAEASEGIVLNANDPQLIKIARQIADTKKIIVRFFGVAKKLKKFFPTDYELAAVDKSDKKALTLKTTDIEVELIDFLDSTVKYKINTKIYDAKLKLTGQHNYLNGAAALALCRELLPDASNENLLDELSKVSLAFGRGEKYRLKNGAQIELVLVKNPASFTQALSSYGGKEAKFMIAINDNIADGRDVSWLWDVNFAPLNSRSIFLTSGSRAVDIALRLKYDNISVKTIEPSLSKALKKLSEQSGEKVILSTYTAMLQLYKLLSQQGEKIS